MKFIISLLACCILTVFKLTIAIETHNEFLAGDCNLYVSSLQSSFTINNLKLLNCQPGQLASIFWSNPNGAALTIEFQRDTQASRPFLLCLRETDYLHKDVPIYRIANNQEILLATIQNPSCFISDQNNKVLLKFDSKGTDYYGQFIHFTIE